MKTEEINFFCKRIGITENQFYGKEEIEGGLDLSSLTSIPEGFNPTVGGGLDLRNLTSIPEGFNPTVGGGLDLRNRSNYIGKDVNIPKIPAPDLKWENGKYICKDGILTEVINNRGNVYKIRKIARKEIEYLITDGNGNWSHGSTLEEAKEDLIYKISDRKKSDYNNLTLDDSLTFNEAVRCYRVITGACSFGTRDFVENRLGDKKSEYKISEIIQLTEGEYGHNSFKEFFNKKD